MSKKILVIDDERGVREVLTEYLEKEGYKVTAVENGGEALSHVKREAYDLAILDLKLPDMEGTEVLRGIRRFDSEVKVVVLTGYPSIKTAAETAKSQALDYLTKPVDIEELGKIVDSTIGPGADKETRKLVEIIDLGTKIKNLRLGAGMTLDEVARKTHLSKGFLSQVENNKVSPHIDTLNRIANKLGVEIGYFFRDPRADDQKVTRERDRKRFTARYSKIHCDLLSSAVAHRKMQPLLYTIPPGESNADRVVFDGGEVFGYVLSGQIEVSFGDETHLLESGDATHFDSSVPYRWKNTGDQAATLLWVTTPPTI